MILEKGSRIVGGGGGSGYVAGGGGGSGFILPSMALLLVFN